MTPASKISVELEKKGPDVGRVVATAACTPICVVRVDRVRVVCNGSQARVIPHVEGYRTVWDTRVRQQTTCKTFVRCRHLKHDESGTKVFWQYARQHAWLPEWRLTLIGDDRTGLMPRDLQLLLTRCVDYRLVLLEIAVDFGMAAGVDSSFIERHGLFGKSRRRSDRGGVAQLRYGGRNSDTLIRCYRKAELGAFRVEVELHSRLLRMERIRKLVDIPKVSSVIVPNHFRMVVVCWQRLGRHLIKRFKERGIRVLDL